MLHPVCPMHVHLALSLSTNQPTTNHSTNQPQVQDDLQQRLPGLQAEADELKRAHEDARERSSWCVQRVQHLHRRTGAAGRQVRGHATQQRFVLALFAASCIPAALCSHGCRFGGRRPLAPSFLRGSNGAPHLQGLVAGVGDSNSPASPR